MSKIVVVFDLDDTLYKEVDYLKSGYMQIARTITSDTWEQLYQEMYKQWSDGEDVFSHVVRLYPSVSKEQLLHIYRTHIPNISIDIELYKMICRFSDSEYHLGIITDGRTVTQRNKIEALRLNALIESSNIYISELTGYSKPNTFSYLEFEKKYPNCSYYYIGDNTAKDFIAPNTLGWITVGIKDNGDNIHKQQNNLPKEYEPKYWINNLMELNTRIDE